ncbi:hypothetical protein RESH_01302 [Rhodopirellula europaea SH398]|uniref:Uncharacterized protein n=1 Tax=Rhodopirellula europaea SH398 TaxID=1263868 RepID=M5S9E5_9BACT|nr:hypothetical protein RESH_01302 [Rhodopirellula europaea SH398]
MTLKAKQPVAVRNEYRRSFWIQIAHARKPASGNITCYIRDKEDVSMLQTFPPTRKVLQTHAPKT